MAVANAPILAASLTLAWDPNQEPDIAGYRLCYGSPTGTFSSVVNVGNATQTTLSNLIPTLTYSFYVTCFNTSGLESEPSNVVQYTVPAANPVNHPPIALKISAVAVTDEIALLTLQGTDADGDPLSFNFSSWPLNGTLTDYAITDGTAATIRYRSTPGFVGLDTFSFNVDDGQETSADALVSIQVTPHNTVPTAFPQKVEARSGLPTQILLLGFDADGDALTYAVAAGPSHGSLAGTPPKLTYTAVAGYTGSDGFTFVVRDGVSSSEPVSVAIAIQPSAPPPEDSGFHLAIEAESAILTAPMQTADEPEASSIGSILTATSNEGTATVLFAVPIESDYVVWCRVRTPSANDDSFYVTLDNDPLTRDIYDASHQVFGEAWHWTPLSGRGSGDQPSLPQRIFHLLPGTHSLTFEGRENNTALDALLITSDLTFNAASASEAQITEAGLAEPNGFLLQWPSFPGAQYQVEKSDRSTSSWTALPEIITATTTRSSFLDLEPPSGTRFYRLHRLP